MRQALDKIAVWVGEKSASAATIAWHQLEPDQLEQVRARIVQDHAPATANKMLSALRGVLRTARQQGLLSEGRYRQLSAMRSVPPSPVHDSAMQPTLRHVEALFNVAAAKPGPTGRRDAALLAVLVGAGLDRTEAAALAMADYEVAAGRLRVRSERRGRARTIPLGSKARRALADWLAVRGRRSGPLLLPIDKGGTLGWRQLTDQVIYDILRRLAERAGTPHVTARALRRLFLERLAMAGFDADEIDRLAGYVRGAAHGDDTLLSERSRKIGRVPDVPYQPPTSGGAT